MWYVQMWTGFLAASRLCCTALWVLLGGVSGGVSSYGDSTYYRVTPIFISDSRPLHLQPGTHRVLLWLPYIDRAVAVTVTLHWQSCCHDYLALIESLLFWPWQRYCYDYQGLTELLPWLPCKQTCCHNHVALTKQFSWHWLSCCHGFQEGSTQPQEAWEGAIEMTQVH